MFWHEMEAMDQHGMHFLHQSLDHGSLPGRELPVVERVRLANAAARMLERTSLPLPCHAESALPTARRSQHRPRTPEGLEALRRPRTIHGFYSRRAIEQRRHAGAARRLLAELFRELHV